MRSLPSPEGLIATPLSSKSGSSPPAYLWHAYGRAVIGTRSDIEKVPIVALQAFYHKYYQPDNAILVLAEQIRCGAGPLAAINATFGAIPKPARKLTPPYTEEPTQDAASVKSPFAAPGARRLR